MDCDAKPHLKHSYQPMPARNALNDTGVLAAPVFAAFSSSSICNIFHRSFVLLRILLPVVWMKYGMSVAPPAQWFPSERGLRDGVADRGNLRECRPAHFMALPWADIKEENQAAARTVISAMLFALCCLLLHSFPRRAKKSCSRARMESAQKQLFERPLIPAAPVGRSGMRPAGMCTRRRRACQPA